MTLKPNRFLLTILLIFTFNAMVIGQQHWDLQISGTNCTLNQVQFLDARNGYAVGEAGTVLRTEDGGENWSDVSIETEYSITDLSFLTIFQGWICTGDPNDANRTGSVWMTPNGGERWIQQNLGTTQARLGISFTDATHGWACGANNGPWDIRATEDGGEHWSLQSGDGYGWLYDVDFVSESVGFIAGVVYFPASTGIVLKTTSGGANWVQLNLGTTPFLNRLEFVDEEHGYTVGETGAVLITADGGLNWTNPNVGTGASLTGVSALSALMAWICGTGGTVIKTEDGGENWSLLDPGTEADFKGICFVDSTTGWAVGSGGVIVKGSTPVSVEPAQDPAPRQFTLLQTYPNPFNSTATVHYLTHSASHVILAVYDLAGRRLETLVSQRLEAGVHEAYWSARGYGTGLYLIKLETAEQTQVERILLMR